MHILKYIKKVFRSWLITMGKRERGKVGKKEKEKQKVLGKYHSQETLSQRTGRTQECAPATACVQPRTWVLGALAQPRPGFTPALKTCWSKPAEVDFISCVWSSISSWQGRWSGGSQRSQTTWVFGAVEGKRLTSYRASRKRYGDWFTHSLIHQHSRTEPFCGNEV